MSTFNKYAHKGAYHYDWYETEGWYKYLVNRAVKFCNGSTIDVGGGDGLLASKIENSTVIDNDQEALNLLGRKQSFAKCDLDDTDSIDWAIESKHDYMACINVIEHLNKPENIKYIINKWVTKGAIITTIDYQGGSLGEDHKFEWTYEQMMDFFKEFNPKGFRYKDTEWIGVEIIK